MLNMISKKDYKDSYSKGVDVKEEGISLQATMMFIIRIVVFPIYLVLCVVEESIMCCKRNSKVICQVLSGFFNVLSVLVALWIIWSFLNVNCYNTEIGVINEYEGYNCFYLLLRLLQV